MHAPCQDLRVQRLQNHRGYALGLPSGGNAAPLSSSTNLNYQPNIVNGRNQ